ncbi:FecCD family ABC transporter permease [Mycoplasmoides alvi]|uniref:FecCD family ABC transporter permease n=1 Tax=Mycoplasmoides alvi TaxID=78580 RepID=UPI00051B9E30|nr:iron chelate uptake ABC transporter family permease subunit [Mycoplasmoides alvi]
MIFLIVSIFLLITIFFIALMVGRYTINPIDFFHATFTGDEGFVTERNVIVNLRLPRTIIACLSGIALSLSGLLYQEIFQNKLTSPDLLGVSNGSGFGAAISIVANIPSVFISVFAFLFGLGAVFLTVFISKLFKNSKSTIFLISGVIVSAFMSSALAFTKYLAKDEVQLSSITYWLMGSFANSSFNKVYVLTPIILGCTIIILLFRWRINIASLGRELAQTKGINYSFYKYAIIAISTLLTASTVAFCGTISWVGLIIPHIVRLVSGKDTAKNVPLCITFGGIFMIFTDILSRSFTSQEIPLSAITGIFGGVIFIGILLTKRKGNYVI